MSIIKNSLAISEINKRHLAIKEIANTAFIAIPRNALVSYKNAFLTPTNHLFVKGKYIPAGVVTTIYDNKQLSFLQRYYLYLKSRFVLPVRFYVGNYTWAHDIWSKNYYHWMCETLPRLYALKLQDTHSIAILPNSFSDCSFIISSLDFLGIEYVLIDSNITNSFSRMSLVETFPPIPELIPYMQISLRQVIMENIIEKEKQETEEKIYISRQKAKRRKIVNEEEVITILEKYNYKIIFAEELSFAEQVHLFSRTKAMISLHGAGHTNIMFMPPNSKVLEIRNDDWNSQPLCFWKLANIFNIRWEYHHGKPTSSATDINDLIIDIANFETDLEKFEQD